MLNECPSPLGTFFVCQTVVDSVPGWGGDSFRLGGLDTGQPMSREGPLPLEGEGSARPWCTRVYTQGDLDSGSGTRTHLHGRRNKKRVEAGSDKGCQTEEIGDQGPRGGRRVGVGSGTCVETETPVRGSGGIWGVREV